MTHPPTKQLNVQQTPFAKPGAPASRRLLKLFFVAALLITVATPASAQEIIMDGKPVSQQAYDYFTKGRELLRANNNADAIELLRKSAELTPDNPTIRHTYAIALAKSGQSSAAIQELQAVISLNQMIPAPWLTIAGLYQSSGDLDKAIEAFKGFLTRFPTDRDAKKVAGLVTGLQSERAQQLAMQAKMGSAAPSDKDYFFEVTREGMLRWNPQSMPLRVCITSGEGLTGYKPQYADLLKQSFESWGQASQGLISFVFVPTPDQAQITCVWSNDPSKFKNIAEAGHAVLDSSQKNGLVKGTLTILTVPLVEQLPITDNRMRRTCLHEIGHVLGLAGHSSNPDDAMFHTMGVVDTWKDLSDRDANTIIRIYSKPTNPTAIR